MSDVVIVLGASLVGAFVKSVTGMGYPLLAVPIISMRLGITDAAVIVAAPNVTANFLLCWHARAARDETRDLFRLVAGSFLGAVVGTFLLVSLPEEPLLVVLALAIAAFVITQLRHPELTLPAAVTHRFSPAAGVVAGILQGAVGVSGPVVAAWVHGYRLGPNAYVFTVTAIFGVSGLVQLALLVGAGELDGDRTLLSALAYVPVLAMLPVGTRLRGRMGGQTFERAVLAVLSASGLALVVQVLS